MSKKILSVGFEFPGNVAEYVPLKSDRSLLDADIIVFQPKMQSQYSSFDAYQGKPLLGQSDSFMAVEDSAHWRSELKAAFDAGKTIIIFLSTLEEYYIYTGRQTHSGTGSKSVNLSFTRCGPRCPFRPANRQKKPGGRRPQKRHPLRGSGPSQ